VDVAPDEERTLAEYGDAQPGPTHAPVAGEDGVAPGREPALAATAPALHGEERSADMAEENR
jgi:hypothetical protein